MQIPNSHSLAHSMLDLAHEATTSELLAFALPLNKNGAPSQPPSLALPRHGLSLAAALLDCASLSLERCFYLHTAATDATKNDVLSRFLLKLTQQSEILGAHLATMPIVASRRPVIALPSVRVALLVGDGVAMLRECVSLEALLSVIRLQQLEVAAAAAPAPSGPPEAADCLPTGPASADRRPGAACAAPAAPSAQ